MAAEVTKIVDPDNGGGTDYTSLDAYEDALGGTTGGGTPGDLPAGDEIAIAQCRSSSGTDDTTPVIFSGWTTDSTRYIKITGGEGVGDFPSDGIYDGTKYVLHNNDTDTLFVQVQENYVRFEHIQWLITETGTNIRRGFFISLPAEANDVRIDSCIFKGVCSGTGTGIGIWIADSDASVTIFNTEVYGFFISADTDFIGILVNNSTVVNIYNSTIYNCTIGISRLNGTANAINTSVFNCDDDISGTVTLKYCATDDGDDSGNNGNITITQSADDWAALVVDAAGGDFSVTDDSSELYNAGNGATPKSIFTDDIAGTTRGPADLDWDIGAFELIVGVGANPKGPLGHPLYGALAGPISF